MNFLTIAESQALAAINTIAKVVQPRSFVIHLYIFVYCHGREYGIGLCTFFEGSGDHFIDHGVMTDERGDRRNFRSRETAIAEAIRMEPFISNEVRKVSYLVTQEYEEPFQLRPRSVEKKSGPNSRHSADGTR